MNACQLSGNVTRDCHVNRLASGTAILNFSVAVNEEYKDKDGNDKKKVNYIDCVRWTRHPERLERILVKGAPVFVLGAVQSESWEDKKTGAKRTAMKIKVEQVVPLREQVEGNGGGAQGQAKQDAAPSLASSAAPSEPASEPSPAGVADEKADDENSLPF